VNSSNFVGKVGVESHMQYRRSESDQRGQPSDVATDARESDVATDAREVVPRECRQLAGQIVVTPTSTPDDGASGAEFVRLLTLYQPNIYLYIRSLVLNPDEAADILQNTNLVLWEKRDQFQNDTSFLAWAFQITRYKLREQMAQRKRKCLCFSDAMVDELALKASQYVGADSDLTDDLRRCLAQLAATDREIIGQRYSFRSVTASRPKAVWHLPFPPTPAGR
jgi:RNA polymerase sigma-70 factor, ECF subfamily